MIPDKLLLLAGSCGFLVGCFAHTGGGASAVLPTGDPPLAGVFELRAGFAPKMPNTWEKESATYATLGFAARGAFGRGFSQLSLAPEGCVLFDRASLLMPMVCLAIPAFQYASLDGARSLGTAAALTPILAISTDEAGFGTVYVAVPIEYASRFGDVPDRLSVGLTVGVGSSIRLQGLRELQKW